MNLDISKTIEPRSDQLNFDDVQHAPVTVTITEARRGTAEQPVELHLAEFPGRPYKPGKSMRRVIINAWGSDATKYVGRSLTLYGDPTIRFGPEYVGGIRISHLSHIDKPVTLPLTVTRGKREPFTVNPLKVETPAAVGEVIADIQAATSLEVLAAVWDVAKVRKVAGHPDVVAAKDQKKAELG